MLSSNQQNPNRPINERILSVLQKSNHINHLKQLQSFLITTGNSQIQFITFKLVCFCIITLSNIDYARLIFNDLHSPNVYLYTAMITAYTSQSDHKSTLLLYRDMVRSERTRPSEFIYPHVLNACLDETHGMVSLDSDYKPNQITVVCILSACGNLGMLQLGRWIHGYIYRNCITPSPFILNALVDMYGKCGSLRIARRVFDHTSTKSLTTWNSMINCLALHGQSETAITVFEEMINYGGSVKPDEVTFIGLLNACTHGGLVEEGRKYFKLMTEDYRIEP
ncbi:hypothetical protein C5167_042111 [Papaver somniferum]|nr:hypothetical protein C5167_042111 [Papaver somniferum]